MWRSGSPPRGSACVAVRVVEWGPSPASRTDMRRDALVACATPTVTALVRLLVLVLEPAERTVALSPERPSPVAVPVFTRVSVSAGIGTSVTSFRFFPVSCFPARSTGPAVSVRASVSACAPFVPARAPVPVIGSARAPCPSSPARRHRPRLGPRHNGVSLFLVRTLESAGSAVTIALWRPALVCPAISEPVPAHASG